MTAMFSAVKKIIVLSVLFILILSPISIHNVLAANSAEGDPVPPSGGGGSGGGGGGGDTYTYVIPLYFTTYYYNLIYVTSGYQTTIKTEFFVNNSNTFDLEPGKTLKITPESVSGIKNGSKIISSAPLQVVIATENVSQTRDLSFAYTLLPMRIWGYKFVNTLPNATLYFYPKKFPTTITIYRPDSNIPIVNQFTITSKFELKAQKGDTILASSQIIILALSVDTKNGAQSELLLPDFLKGKQYQGIKDMTFQNNYSLSITYYEIYSNNKTSLVLTYQDKTKIQIIMNANSSIQLIAKDQLHGNIQFITSDQKITLTFKTKSFFGGTIFASSAQMPALEEMNAAEFFALPQLNYGASYQIFPRKIPSTIYNLYTENNEYYLFSNPYNLTDKQSLTYLISNNQSKPYLMITSQAASGLGYSSEPRYYPSQVSYAFPLVPLNPVSFNESLKGFESTWYRYTDLIVEEIRTIPQKPEELSSLTIYVVIKNNGTLPSGKFTVEIKINGQIEINREISYLAGLQTYMFEIRRFEGIGKHVITVDINIDPLNLIDELSETNNQANTEIHVGYNIRFRVTVVLIIAVIIYWLSKKLYSKYKLRKIKLEAEADVVLGVNEL